MPSAQAQRSKRWRAAHPDRVREQRRRYLRNARMRALKLLSGGEPHCACCGWNQVSGPNRLEFDHINGGGRKLTLKSHSADLSMKILRGEAGFRVLCRACNSIMEPAAKYCVVHRPRFGYANRLHFHSASVHRTYMDRGALSD